MNNDAEKPAGGRAPGEDALEKKEAEFNVSVKAFVHRDDGKLLILKTSGIYGEEKWELPGGVIDATEVDLPLEKVLGREIDEECGSEFHITVGPLSMAWQRGPRPPFGALFNVGFTCHYQGGEITLSKEHTDSAWIDGSEVANYRYPKGFDTIIADHFKKMENTVTSGHGKG